MIATIAGSEVVDVEHGRKYELVELTEYVPSVGVIRLRSFEFHCTRCGAHGVDLMEQEAADEMVEHVCPDVPPCGVE
jgi:hypothetical protein